MTCIIHSFVLRKRIGFSLDANVAGLSDNVFDRSLNAGTLIQIEASIYKQQNFPTPLALFC